MKLISILTWYDESPSWLAATVASLARMGTSHLVALDGAYALYPQGRARSGFEQHQAIMEVANGLGIGCTLHAPTESWQGNEVEKRSFGFQAAELVAEPNEDWYFLMDADQVVIQANEVHEQLEQTELDVAQVTFCDRHDPFASEKTTKFAQQQSWPREHRFSVRCLFRAIPGLKVQGNHYTYVTPDQRILWGNPQLKTLEPCLDLSASVHVEHRSALRDVARRDAQRSYYKLRHAAGVEAGPCVRCEKRLATRSVSTDFEPHEEDGLMGMKAGYTEVCDECALIVEAENERVIREHGFDPADFLLETGRPVAA